MSDPRSSSRLDRDRPIRRVGPNGDSDEFPPDGLTPDQAERLIRHEPREWLYVFTPDGRQIARFRGTRSEVSVSEELASRKGMRGLYGEPVLKDCTIVHNHPPDSETASFPISPSDLAFAVAFDLRQFVVVSGGNRYELRQPLNGWAIDDLEVFDLFVELIAVVARRTGLDLESSSHRTVLNQHVFALMQERGLIGYAQSTIADDD